MSALFIALIVAVVVFGIGLIAFFVRASEAAERRKRTLHLIQGARSVRGHGGAGGAKSRQHDRRAEISRKLKEQSDQDNKEKQKNSLSVRITQAGINTMSPKKFILISLVFGLVVTGLAWFLKAPVLSIPLIFIVGFLGIPRLVLKKMALRRQKKFLSEFADALEAMVRLLKAGMPVSEAIAMVAREYTGPVGEEMSRIYDTQKIGVPLPEAALMATRRMPITEMQMFATGLSIQAQTGASLSEVLTNLANVIRSRFRLKRKIKALSSEAKASASIIGALPVFVSSGIYFINPEFMSPLFHTTTGNLLLAGAIGWMGIGVFIMKIMINFKV